MISFRLNTVDLSHIRFAVSPIAQVSSSAVRMPHISELPRHRARQRQLLRQLGPQTTPLMRLRTVPGYTFPDFVNPVPVESEMTLSDQLDLLLTTPQWRLSRDLEPWSSAGSNDVEPLDDVRGQTFRSLRDALHAYFRDGVAEQWPIIHRGLRQEIARRNRDLGARGLDYVLNSIHPRLRWHPPFLSTDLTAADLPAEIELNGRGVVFVPSLWWSSTFTAKINDWDPLVITYPVAPRLYRRLVDMADRTEKLTQLIGRTRATVLVHIHRRPGQTTSQIGAECAISVSSVSEHTKALRESGLITAVRDRNAVRHQITDLGARLIRGA